MPIINHWWSTRPKRKLILLPDTLRVFAAVAEGRVWRGNRDLHLQFEDQLEQRGIKRVGERRDRTGGGGRTYASWLFSFGMWFEDQYGVVRLTCAGEDIVIRSERPIPILTKQLLDFQYPSPYSIDTKVNSRFHLFPFRFLLKLLIDPRLGGTISKQEIARFVLPLAETDNDQQRVISEILRHRTIGDKNRIPSTTFESDYGMITKLEDSANTFINQLEYTQLIVRTNIPDNDSMSIDSGREGEIRRLLADQPPLQTRALEREVFQRHYGLGPRRSRDNRTFQGGTTITAQIATRSQVLVAYYNAVAHSPINSLSENILNQISNSSGIPRDRVELIIDQLGVRPSLDEFEERYLTYAFGGLELCDEFEQATEGILGIDGFGFKTKWVGSKPNNPDVLAISNEDDNIYLGIFDAKAYSDYTISGNHARTMEHVYINNFRSYEDDQMIFDLAFFSYVAGGFGNSIDQGIRRISERSTLQGSAITARCLLDLLAEHRRRGCSKHELKELFQRNRLIRSNDFIQL